VRADFASMVPSKAGHLQFKAFAGEKKEEMKLGGGACAKPAGLQIPPSP